MTTCDAFRLISPTTLADVLGRNCVMDMRVRPLWAAMPRISGPAYPVRCVPGDNLMLHAAIYRAPVGSVVVVESGDMNFALTGGNLCAVAQRHGIAGFVLDGLVRDLQQIRALGFPVFACGITPIAGSKERLGTLNRPIVCAGINVSAGDIVVADEDGVVVTPCAQIDSVLQEAQARSTQDASQTLTEWEPAHYRRIEAILHRCGFKE